MLLLLVNLGGAGDPSGKKTNWEPVADIVSTCEKLIGNGKKSPARLLANIKSAIEASEGVGGFLGEPGKSNVGEQGEEDEEVARGRD